ncbi:MAG: septum formation initiator family protein [Prevotella sp.]|jgi:cell division protein FtsB|nr:septum formation initiator family protein [Prevotella sp.]
MAERLGSVWRFLSHNKYWIVIFLGVLIVGFLDDNSFLQRMEQEFQIRDLKSQIQEYNDRYESDSRQLRELNRNPKAIEKIARERYFMKADDEDIFVLSDDARPTVIANETTE